MKKISILFVGLLLFDVLNSVYVTSAFDMNSSRIMLLSSVDLDKSVKPLKVEQSDSYRVVTKNTGLNVRKGPGTQFAIVGSVAKGSIVDCGFKQPDDIGNWMYGSGIDEKTGKKIYGYMCSDYLESIS